MKMSGRKVYGGEEEEEEEEEEEYAVKRVKIVGKWEE
jgi:hypothetical protein